jgi:hypothetical protein
VLFDVPEPQVWTRVDKFSPTACALADRHYSRRKPGSGQFMPPGQTIVLYRERAVFGWWRPDPDAGIVPMNGLDGWTCTIFRNESDALSSQLILEAELALTYHADGCGPDGMLTYVWDDRVASANPGYCFKCAGWIVAGRSADDKKTLLTKPFELAGASLIPPSPNPREANL